ncbi:MAG: epoxyqueuosine reductase QueH [bacterium]|nr:epoxyqueuosine reductase QueH [bacterium]
MEKLLLHICCGPCSAPIIPNLNTKFDVLGFYFNPNIYPETEFEQRLASAKKVVEFNGIGLIVPEQERDDFFEYIGDTKTKPDRCLLCYKQRLARTAEYASENGFSHFSTTLLISPFQYHDKLKEIGEEAGKEFGIKFYYQDFRPLYKESREISRGLELYLQKYCGCKFSRKRK